MEGRFKQNTIILICLGAASALILLVGLFFFQQMESQANEMRQQAEQRRGDCREILKKLRKPEIDAGTLSVEAINIDNWKQESQEFSAVTEANAELESLNKMLASLKRNLMDFEYIPTYLAQIQHTTIATGNQILSISPGEKKQIDFNGSLFKPVVSAGQPGTPAPAKEPAPPVPVVSQKMAALYQEQVIGLNIKGDYVSIIRLLNALRQFPQLIYVKNLSLNPAIVKDKRIVTVNMQTYALILPGQNQAADAVPATPHGAEPARGEAPQ